MAFARHFIAARADTHDATATAARTRPRSGDVAVAESDPEVWWYQQHYIPHIHLYRGLDEPLNESHLLGTVDASLSLLIDKQRKIQNQNTSMELDFDTDDDATFAGEVDGDFMNSHLDLCILRLRHLQHLLRYGVHEKHPWFPSSRFLRPLRWAASELRTILDQSPLSPIYRGKTRYRRLLQQANAELNRLLDIEEKLQSGLFRAESSDFLLELRGSIRSLFQLFNNFWCMHHFHHWREELRDTMFNAVTILINNPIYRIDRLGMNRYDFDAPYERSLQPSDMKRAQDDDRRLLLKGYALHCESAAIVPYLRQVGYSNL